MELENGYDTMVGERGTTLSGGQRQRIAIARTFIRNMPILILDEPMTGLDIESESAVREALRRLMAGRTSILITHDLETASEADLILLLADGRIIEQGSHQELLVRKGQYRDLWEFRGRAGTVSEIRT
jgi:ATP-binding cassette, subfamily B, bacterial